MREVLLRLKEALLANIKDIGNDLPVSHILCLSRLFEYVPLGHNNTQTQL